MKIFDFEKYGNEMPVPSGEIHIINPSHDEIESMNLDQYVEDRNAILIGIPGAFTPTCTEKHLPGFVANEQNLYNKGIDEIICLSVNDPHVMRAFSDYINFEGSRITMAADPFGEIAEQLGLLTDMGVLGKRCKRFAAIIQEGKIVDVMVDERGLDVSSAENCLKKL
jgi:peroxiredoxin|tara:strand:- start:231 stop:731 length:501 start_codon:yes stop_codon:yes gene_type:complete